MFFLISWLVGVKHTTWLIAGLNVATEETKAKIDLPAIWRIMGIAYLILGFVFVTAGFLNLAGVSGAVFFAFVIMFFGAFFLTIFVQKYNGNNFNAEGKPVKQLKYVVGGTSLFMIIAVGFVCWQGTGTLKEPRVSFEEDKMIIDCEYGISVSATEIENVYLIDMPVIFSYRTNGASLFGTYRGHYISDMFSDSVLVYAKEDSLPWICIQRNKESILIGLSDHSDTNVLYKQILSWLD